MTIIAAAAWGGCGAMVGDRAAANASTYEVMTAAEPKIARYPFGLVGYTASFEVPQILVPVFTDHGTVDSGKGLRDLIGKMREALTGAGWRAESTTGSPAHDGLGLLILSNRGRVVQVSSTFQTNMYRERYAAIGCGGSYALGAMHAAKASRGTAAAAALAGGRAAVAHSGFCVGPLDILTV